MKRYIAVLLVVLTASVGVVPMLSAAVDKRRKKTPADSVVARPPHSFFDTSKKQREISIDSRQMASSAFPVRMVVKGSSLCVTSDYSQILPIYTRGGSFYMAMRLNKGLNWLNGLPRGRYLINRQQISIP